MKGGLAERSELRLGKHDVVPRRHGLYALGQVSETRTRLRSARRPKSIVERLARPAVGPGEGLSRSRPDGGGAQVELGDHLLNAAVQGSIRTQSLLPKYALLIRRRPAHLEDHRGPLTGAPTLAAGHDQGAAGPFQEVRHQALTRGVVAEILAVEQQRAPPQRGLALPQPHEDVEFVRCRGNGMGRHHVQGEPYTRRRLGGDPTLRWPLVPHQLHHGKPPRCPRPDCGDRFGNLEMGGHELFGVQRHRLHETLQVLVEVAEAGQVMQDALIDAERAGCQALTRAHLDQPPVSQGRAGGERAPVGFGQHGQGQAECGSGTLWIPLGSGTERPKGGLELYTGAQQENVALESRKAESLAKCVESGRSRQALDRRCQARFPRGGFARGHKIGIGRSDGGCVALERLAHDPDRRHQIALVGLVPGVLSHVGPIHLYGITAVGPT